MHFAFEASKPVVHLVVAPCAVMPGSEHHERSSVALSNAGGKSRHGNSRTYGHRCTPPPTPASKLPVRHETCLCRRISDRSRIRVSPSLRVFLRGPSIYHGSLAGPCARSTGALVQSSVPTSGRSPTSHSYCLRLALHWAVFEFPGTRPRFAQTLLLGSLWHTFM